MATEDEPAGPEADSEIRGLVERLGRGDESALAELFDRHRDHLRRMVEFRLDPRLGGRVSASDVVQDAFLDARARVGHFLGRGDAMPALVWLRLITGQRLVEVHRRHLGARGRDAGREVSIDQAAGPAASSFGLAAHLVGHLTSPSQAAIKAEALAQLDRVLSSLDPIDREVLALRHFEELGNAEAAQILGINKAAASKRYVRALERLREALIAIPGFLGGDDDDDRP